MKKNLEALMGYLEHHGDPEENKNEDPGLGEDYHRDQIFEEEKRSDYLWCLHCQRTYKRGEFRWVGKFQMCPYEDCDGSTVLDGIDWERFRDDYSKYPVIPEPGRTYPMYDIGDDFAEDIPVDDQD